MAILSREAKGLNKAEELPGFLTQTHSLPPPFPPLQLALTGLFPGSFCLTGLLFIHRAFLLETSSSPSTSSSNFFINLQNIASAITHYMQPDDDKVTIAQKIQNEKTKFLFWDTLFDILELCSDG